jgi:alpha-amylase
MKSTTALWLLAYAAKVMSLDPAGWRNQSIYQLLSDRFARTDGSTTAPCNTADGVYCGGSWQGIIDKLDYIKDMGFTAVSDPLKSYFMG